MMRKIFAFILVLCLVASAFCFNSFAAEDPDVIRVSGLKRNGDLVVINSYKTHAEGWEAATDLARDGKAMKNGDYARVVVDLLADWNAVNGEFCDSGHGFNYDAIRFYDDTKITLNMNGHTINRGLTDWQYNGEVIYVAEGADVIINGGKDKDPIVKVGEITGNMDMGTITGGWSCNGAGGIHIDDNATVTLNNVAVMKNTCEDDDGGGIALYDGATLIMNGGCVYDNRLASVSVPTFLYGGGIYVEESSAILTDVTIQGNQGNNREDCGAAIYAYDSDVKLEGCEVIGNGQWVASNDPNKKADGLWSVIHGVSNSLFTIIDTNFSKNGHNTPITYDKDGDEKIQPTSLILLEGSEIVMDKCSFSNNNSMYLLDIDKTKVTITETDFNDGFSQAIRGNAKSGASNTITDCTFGNGEVTEFSQHTIYFNKAISNLTFIDCDFGDATFNSREGASFIENEKEEENEQGKIIIQDNSWKGTFALIGSMVGSGSLGMIVSIVAVLLSLSSVGLSIALNKKRTTPVAESESEEAESDEDENKTEE